MSKQNASPHRIIYIGSILLLLVWATWQTAFNPAELVTNFDQFVLFLTEDFFPPAILEGAIFKEVVDSILVTLAMALLATTTAGIMAFLVALFGSEYLSPIPLDMQVYSYDSDLYAKYSCIGFGHIYSSLR